MNTAYTKDTACARSATPPRPSTALGPKVLGVHRGDGVRSARLSSVWSSLHLFVLFSLSLSLSSNVGESLFRWHYLTEDGDFGEREQRRERRQTPRQTSYTCQRGQTLESVRARVCARVAWPVYVQCGRWTTLRTPREREKSPSPHAITHVKTSGE